MSGYQPDWADGKEVGTGWRDSASRYDAIASYLRSHGPLEAPTVLDIGAYKGYFCKRLYEDFGAYCTAVDPNPGLINCPAHPCTIWKIITPQEIQDLGRFDVVLCLSVLHHHKNWYEYLQAILEVGDICFIETANPQEHLGRRKSYALGAHQQLTKYGEVLTETLPMTGENNPRPLWVVDRRVVRGEDEQVAMLTEILNGFEANTADSQFHCAPESAQPMARGLVEALKFHGWTLSYDPAITAANLKAAVAANPVPHMAVPLKPQSLADAIAEARFGKTDTNPWTDQ